MRGVRVLRRGEILIVIDGSGRVYVEAPGLAAVYRSVGEALERLRRLNPLAARLLESLAAA